MTALPLVSGTNTERSASNRPGSPRELVDTPNGTNTGHRIEPTNLVQDEACVTTESAQSVASTAAGLPVDDDRLP